MNVMNKFLVAMVLTVFSVGAFACNGHGKADGTKAPTTTSAPSDQIKK